MKKLLLAFIVTLSFAVTTSSALAQVSSCATATSIGNNTTVAGSISSAGQNNYYRVTLTEPGTLDISTTGGTDTYGYLLDSNCAQIVTRTTTAAVRMG